MPVTDIIIRKLEKIPLIVEIWKREIKDSLFGVTRIKLSELSESLVNPVTGEVGINVIKNSLYPFILYDNNAFEINSLQYNLHGYLHASIAFGTLRQIGKYESMLTKSY